MRQVVCHEFGPLSALAVEDAPVPEPGPDEVLIEVGAAAVSFVDGLLVQGLYQVRPPLPFVPGLAVAGEVVAHGTGVTAPAVGRRVVTASPSPGGYATHVTARATACVPVPAAVTDDVAASMIEGYATARFALVRRAPLSPGQWVVVLGAGGGVGLAAVDVARSLGARVVAAASSPAKLAAAHEAGAEATISTAEEDLKQRIREITGGGADVVVDPVGGPHAEAALRALAPFGRYLVVGFAAGEIPRLPANRVLIGNRTVLGVDWGDYVRSHPEELTGMLTEVLRATADGELRPTRPRSHPLEGAAEALSAQGRRQVVGKLVLVP